MFNDQRQVIDTKKKKVAKLQQEPGRTSNENAKVL